MKICNNPDCKIKHSQSLDNYFKKSMSKDGLYGRCKTCVKENNLRYYQKNRKDILLKYKEKYKKDPEKYIQKSRDNNKKTFFKRKDYILKRNFGLSLTEFQKIKEQQNEKCAICLQTEVCSNKDLAVDHCHRTGKVRGLLCSRCNQGLGSFKDNINYLTKAIEYIIKNKGEDNENINNKIS